MVIKKFENKLWKDYYTFYCPGCRFHHGFKTSGEGPCWTFNEDEDNPTVTPSILNKYSDGSICHLFIKNGKIQFLNDCTHDFAGKTVDMKKET